MHRLELASVLLSQDPCHEWLWNILSGSRAEGFLKHSCFFKHSGNRRLASQPHLRAYRISPHKLGTALRLQLWLNRCSQASCSFWHFHNSVVMRTCFGRIILALAELWWQKTVKGFKGKVYGGYNSASLGAIFVGYANHPPHPLAQGPYQMAALEGLKACP